MPTPRSEIAVARASDKIFVSGGIGLMGSVKSLEVYDTVKDHWSSRAPHPTPLHHHGLAVMEDRLYAVGGYTDLKMTPTAASWSYDPRRNRWSRIANLPESRAGFVLVYFDGGLVAVGGVGKNPRMLWKYIAKKDAWQAFGPTLISPREHHAAAVLDGNLYVFGGRWHGRNLSSVEAYDPREGRWQSRARMPTARSGISGAAAAGKVHVIGGEDLHGGCVFNAHEIYDPTMDSWEIAPGAPTGRHGLGVVGMENRLLVFGGAHRPGIMTPLAVTSKVEVLTLQTNK